MKKRLKAKGEGTYETSVVNLPEGKFFEAAGTDRKAPQPPSSDQSNAEGLANG